MNRAILVPMCSILLVAMQSIAQDEDVAFSKIPDENEESLHIAADGSTNFPFDEFSGDASEKDLKSVVLPFCLDALIQRASAPGALQSLTFDSERSRVEHVDVNQWFVTARFRWNEIPLAGRSLISATVTDKGALLRFRNTPTRVESAPASPLSEANPDLIPLQIAATEWLTTEANDAGVPFDKDSIKFNENGLEIWVNPADSVGRLAERFRVNAVDPTDQSAMRFLVWVGFEGGVARVWESRDLIARSHFGQVYGYIWDPTPAYAPRFVPLRNIIATRTMKGVTDMDYTDEFGIFVFPTGDERAEVSVELKTDSFSIKTLTDEGLQSSNATIQYLEPNESVEFDMTEYSVADIARSSAIYWADQAKSFADLAMNGVQQVSFPITLILDRTRPCDGEWDPEDCTINLGREGLRLDPCVNMAYRDIVFHEYGHAVLDSYAIEGRFEAAPTRRDYKEGMADAFAVLRSGLAVFGEDAGGLGVPLRAISEIVLWPGEPTDPYYSSKIYSGFVWELVNCLKRQMSESDAYSLVTELLLKVAKKIPITIECAVNAAFEVSSVDATLTGSPYIDCITSAACTRRIPVPPVVLEFLAHRDGQSPM